MTTIIHGELWDGNILINATDNNAVKLLDWKNGKVSSATLDLALLMLTSTSSQMR